jgi:cell division septum initiation protein DivIVA
MADNATLKSQYLAQIQADLERTAKEKERIANELAVLQEQLASLEQDHALLVGVQQALAGQSSAPSQNTGPAEAPEVPQATVPTPRKPKAAPRTPRQATRKTKTTAGHSTGTSSPAPASTLVGLVVADLTGRSEPRSAAEVTTALAQAHPDRKIQNTVVRNTLEALVAKGQALRSKQGRSVYYSATGDPAVASTADVAEAAEAAA